MVNSVITAAANSMANNLVKINYSLTNIEAYCMNPYKLMALVLSATLLLSGCSKDPLSVELPTNGQKLGELEKYAGKLDGENKRLFSEFMKENVLAMTVGNTPSGMTIGEAIEYQKKQESDLLEEQAAKQAAVDALNKTVDALYWGHTDFNASGYQGYDIRVKLINKQDKPIIGVKGDLIFKDIYGEDDGKVAVEYNDVIQGNGIAFAQVRGIPALNQGMKFNGGKYQDENVRFEPRVVVFADKTSLSVADS